MFWTLPESDMNEFTVNTFLQIKIVFEAFHESVLTKSVALGLSKESLRSDG